MLIAALRPLRRTLTSAALLASLLLSSGCTSNEYKDLPPDRQQIHHGTQPGYHRLSTAFAVDVDKGLMTFYFLGIRGDQVKQPIGVVAAIWGDYANYGPREIAFAISDDGKRLVFFDEPGIGSGKPIATRHGRVVADLYRIDADKGERELIYQDIHRRSFHCVDYPRNVVHFGKVQPDFSNDGFAYSTEGEEISLEERDRKLREAGRADRICGPL